VAEAGYAWTTAIPADPHARSRESTVFLTDGHGIGMGHMVRRYSPLRNAPALFRTFIDLEPTQEAVLAFANEYGLLGDPVASFVALPATGTSAGGLAFDIAAGVDRYIGIGEQLCGWERQIMEMRELVELWDAATSESALMEQRIVWHPDRVEYRNARTWALIAGSMTEPELFARFRRGERVRPALMYLQKRVNEKISEHTTARLLWDPEGTLLRLHVVPRSLVAALWLQFARAIEGQRRYLTCVQCRRWMEISPDVRRSDARFCSGTCRTRAHRERRHRPARNLPPPVAGEGSARA
jgi:hypothetical protein